MKFEGKNTPGEGINITNASYIGDEGLVIVLSELPEEDAETLREHAKTSKSMKYISEEDTK